MNFCKNCKNFVNSEYGMTCKIFGNPFDKDISNCGCDQFFEPIVTRGEFKKVKNELVNDSGKMVWCVFEESSHDDPYDTGNDGKTLVAVCETKEGAISVMQREFSKHELNDTDTVCRSEYCIELSKWIESKLNREKKLDHVCDWRWSIVGMGLHK